MANRPISPEQFSEYRVPVMHETDQPGFRMDEVIRTTTHPDGTVSATSYAHDPVSNTEDVGSMYEHGPAPVWAAMANAEAHYRRYDGRYENGGARLDLG